MPRIVRAQLAQEIGERLQEAGKKVGALNQYSGDALEGQIMMINTILASQVNRLDTLVRSCRSGKNSYPNYPALRLAIGDAGDEVYEIQGNVKECLSLLNSSEGPNSHGYISENLLILGQKLRLVSFVPPERKEAANA